MSWRQAAAAVVLLAATACSTPAGGLAPPQLGTVADTWPSATVTVTVTGEDSERRFTVRVADTPERRRHGLMGVQTVAEGVGLLFVYDQPTDGGFWMKDTLVPLDIAFVADGQVVAVDTMHPCRTDRCPVHTSPAAYDAALETAAGGLAGVRSGDRVDVELTEDSEP